MRSAGAGVKIINLSDSTFNFSTARTDDFCERFRSFRKEFPGVTWTANMRTDGVDEDMVVALKKSGLSKVFFGIESANQKTLDRLHRDQKTRETRAVVELFLKHKIATFASFQICFPWETAAEMWNTVKLSVELQRNGARTSLYRSTVFPGTDMSSAKSGRSPRFDYTHLFSLSHRVPLFHPLVSDAEIYEMVEYSRNSEKLNRFISSQRAGRSRSRAARKTSPPDARRPAGARTRGRGARMRRR
jgi:radical SAM superfamily enzyme YgiQ (UPF0313 family)